MSKKKKKYEKGECFVIGIIGAFAGIILVAFIGYILMDISFLEPVNCPQNSHKIVCLNLVDKNWNSEKYLSIITSFYSTIIVILIGLVGAIAVLAFIVVRANALQQADEAIEREVNRYFSTSRSDSNIQENLEEMGSKLSDELKGRIEDIEGVLEDKFDWHPSGKLGGDA